MTITYIWLLHYIILYHIILCYYIILYNIIIYYIISYKILWHITSDIQPKAPIYHEEEPSRIRMTDSG